MSSKSYAALAALIFTIAALAQLARAYTHTSVLVGGHEIPVMASWILGGVLALIALLGYTARRG